jgi:receptor expression-enhancing protein 5/6
MAQVYIKQLDELLHKESKLTPYFEQLEAKTGCKRLYFALGFFGFLVLYIIFGYGGGLICNLVGFVLPAYKSIKAIESECKEDDTQWLTYWVVYGAFMIVEFFSDIILSWFPFYFLAKLIFLTWCMAPYQWNGASFIYFKFLQPFVKKHERRIDAYLDEGTRVAQQGIKTAGDMGSEAAVQHMMNQAMEVKESGEKKDE